MKSTVFVATLTFAVSAVASQALAQRLYRCGNEFSQTPCGDSARVVDVQPASGYSRQYQAEQRRRSSKAHSSYLRIENDLKRRITAIDGALKRYRDSQKNLALRPARDTRNSTAQQRIEAEWAAQRLRMKDHITWLESERVQRATELAQLKAAQERRPDEATEDHLARLERESAARWAEHNTAKENWNDVNLR
jgi:hypothetical protein